MTKYLIGVLNLFIIPIIAVLVAKKIRGQKKIKFFEFVFNYAVYAVSLMLVSFGISVVAEYVLSRKVYFYEFYYTGIAVFFSVILPFFFARLHFTIKRIPIIRAKKKKADKKVNAEE